MVPHLWVANAVHIAFWTHTFVSIRFQVIQHVTAMFVCIRWKLDEALNAGDAVTAPVAAIVFTIISAAAAAAFATNVMVTGGARSINGR